MQVESNQDTIYENEPNGSISCGSSISTDYIRIYVYQPFLRIKHIKLDSHESISILNQLYPSDSIYLFNGQILDNNKPFFYYDIENGNKIVLLSSSHVASNPHLIEKWKKLTSDKSNFEYNINLNINKSTRFEVAKLRDLRFNKIEVKKRRLRDFYRSKIKSQKYLGLFDNFNMNFDSNENEKDIENSDLIINYISPVCPSNDPLPILW